MNEFEVVYAGGKFMVITRGRGDQYWTTYLNNAESQHRAQDIVDALREGERRNND